jgi:hypothetical protein
MKHLALIVGAAALAFPAAGFAKDYKSSNDDSHHYTYKRVDANSSADQGEYRIEMQSEEDFRNLRGRANSFTTLEGEQLQIEGDTVYKVTTEGERFYAPNGSYPVRSGQVVVVEDGQFKRLEQAPEVVILDMDRDKNRM